MRLPLIVAVLALVVSAGAPVQADPPRRPKVRLVDEEGRPIRFTPTPRKSAPVVSIPSGLIAPRETDEGRPVKRDNSDIVPNSIVWRYADTGLIAHVEGDYRVPEAKTPTEVAERFLRTYYRELGLDEDYRQELALIYESPDRGTMVLRYEQIYQQVPVLDSFILFYVGPDLVLKGLDAHVIRIEDGPPLSMPTDSSNATSAVIVRLRSELGSEVEPEDFPSAKLAVKVEGGRARSHWIVGFNTVNPPVYWQALVDAETNEVVSLFTKAPKPSPPPKMKVTS